MYEFEDDAPVLWMEPQEPPSAVEHTIILWPAWAYTVLAPRVVSRPDDRLDVFQEAILRLLRADTRDEREIASSLHLNRKLAAYIKAGLRDLHLCDDRFVITDRGLRALHDADPEHGESCKGFVFQDPSSRILWGRFVERLEIRDVEWHGQTPVLILGSVGRPFHAKGLAVPPRDGVAPKTPRATDVLEAVGRHRRLLRFGVDASAGGSASGAPENIQRVTVISDDPMPVWLGTYLYATDYEEEDATWNVADPFGYGTSPVLRAEVARRAIDFKPLHGAIRRLVEPQQIGDRRTTHMQRVELARLDLLERFGVSLDAYPDLEMALADLLIAVERAGEDDRDIAGRKDAMVRVQRGLEEVLRLPLPESADASAVVDLIDDRDYDAKILDARATALGFDPLPRGMRFVQAGKIRSALNRRAGSLRPLALANLLLAVTDPGHEFHEAARQNPRLLNDLDSMASIRDRSAHAGGTAPAMDELMRIADDALEIARSLVELHQRIPTETIHG